MLIKAGVDGKALVFLFSDNQIKEESFVEDINMILNTGDIPNIFPSDEKADLIEKMQTVARVEVNGHNITLSSSVIILVHIYHLHSCVIRSLRHYYHPIKSSSCVLSIIECHYHLDHAYVVIIIIIIIIIIITMLHRHALSSSSLCVIISAS